MSQPSQTWSNLKTINFMIVLSFICALVLSLLASALSQPQEEARELFRSKQLLLSARIISPEGFFLVKDTDGQYVPAKYIGDGTLAPGNAQEPATAAEILAVYRKRIHPMLVNDKGDSETFEQAKINMGDYLSTNKKFGYANLPWKLLYEILPNPTRNQSNKSLQPEGYVIPISGFGLWDFIYGYLAIQPDGNTVIGIAWYDHKETPGLGANIAEPWWQKQFEGKHIFQSDASGKTNFQNTSLGITVIKGKVKEVMGNNPRGLSYVDGMSGATLTGNGVTKAYKDTLDPYRPFLLRLHEESEKGINASKK